MMSTTNTPDMTDVTDVMARNDKTDMTHEADKTASDQGPGEGHEQR